MSDKLLIEMSEEEWIKSWKREAPHLTLQQYKDECERQADFLINKLGPFFTGEAK